MSKIGVDSVYMGIARSSFVGKALLTADTVAVAAAVAVAFVAAAALVGEVVAAALVAALVAAALVVLVVFVLVYSQEMRPTL